MIVDENDESTKILKNTLNIMLDKTYDISLESLRIFSINFENSNPKNYKKKLPCFTQCVGKTEISYKDSSYDNIYISSYFAETYNFEDEEIINFQLIKKPLSLKSVLMIPKDTKSIELTSGILKNNHLIFC